MGAFLLLGLLVCGADRDVTLKEIDLTLLAQIGRMQYQSRHEYGGDLGYSIEYRGRQSKVTLYVYDLGQKEIPDGKMNPAVAGQLQSASAEIEEAANQGIYEIQERMQGELPFSKTVQAAFVSTGFGLKAKSQNLKSYAFVTGRKGRFVKVRATQLVTDGRADDTELQVILDTLARHLLPLEQSLLGVWQSDAYEGERAAVRKAADQTRQFELTFATQQKFAARITRPDDSQETQRGKWSLAGNRLTRVIDGREQIATVALRGELLVLDDPTLGIKIVFKSVPAK